MNLYPTYGPGSLLRPPKKPPEKIRETPVGAAPAGSQFASKTNSRKNASS